MEEEAATQVWEEDEEPADDDLPVGANGKKVKKASLRGGFEQNIASSYTACGSKKLLGLVGPYRLEKLLTTAERISQISRFTHFSSKRWCQRTLIS